MPPLVKAEVMLPDGTALRLDDLLVFDSRCVDVEMRQELLRLFPRLVHLRRAWRVHFTKHGCLSCARGSDRADSIFTIAARLRRRGLSWSEVYELVGMKAKSHAAQKNFRGIVNRKAAHFDDPTPEPSYRYGAGGFCDRCYLRIRRELASTIRKMHAGRDAAEEAAALTRRFDVARWLLGSEESWEEARAQG